MQTLAVHVRYGPLLDFARTLVCVRAMREREGAKHDPPINLVSPSPSAPRPSVNTATNAVSEEKTSPPYLAPTPVGVCGLRERGCLVGGLSCA